MPPGHSDLRLHPATTAADWDDVRALFVEYVAGLGVDLAFQGFEAELAGLPGAYAPPAGTVLLARVDGAAAACGAVRPRPELPFERACEMKRLYARPGYRGLGLGRRVALALMDQARAAGHATMLLDTLSHMGPAQALYASLGFVEIAPYYNNPLTGTRYLCARLQHAPHET